jgi:hypothetical protein
MLAAVAVWFMVSVVVEIFGNLAFLVWLRRQGAAIRFGWAGMPGYLDRVYVDWCRAQGRSPGHVVLLRRLSLANMILAAFIAIPVLAGSRSPP